MFGFDRRPPEWIAFAIAGVTLLAPALGGSTELWAMATLTALTAALFLIAPPRRALPVLPTLLLALLLLLALVSFLPAAWFPTPAWRTELLKLGATLPSTRTPQPWLTAQWCCLLGLCLLWSYYLLAFEWTRATRETALITYAVGVLVLGAVFITAHVIKLPIPFWPETTEFGPFPNRNQTSNVFGLAGIVIYAIGLLRLQERRETWWIWLCSLSLICWALILNYSRAGILLFFAGALAWHAWWFFQARERRGPLIALCGLALLVGLLFLNGGKTLARFQGENLGIAAPAENGRIQIFRDALHLSKEQPLLGAGLGNFRSLFSAARSHFVSTSEAVHPESDWLWGVVDLGWLGPLFVLGLIGWWISRCFPFDPGTVRPLRVAAMIAALAFAFHSLFDVSAHRLGTLWPALLLASVARSPEVELPRSQSVRRAFHFAALLLFAISGWWFASIIDETRLPTSEEVARLEHETESAASVGDYERALEAANAGLEAAPLDWLLYYHRGVAEAALYLTQAETRRDFAIARYLYPHWPDLYLREGQAWMERGDPDASFAIWEEGMQRLGPSAFFLFNSIYPFVRDDASLRDRWRTLAGNDPRCALTFLSLATPVEFDVAVTQVLERDPELHAFSEAERERFFQAWYQNGNKLSLLEFLQQHPALQKIAWRQLAMAYADYQDYRPACETITRFAPAAALPEVDPASLDSLAARFRARHDSGNEGLLLATAEYQTGAADEALRTITVALADERAPRQLYFLAAQIWSKKGDWQKAWQSLRQYAQL